MVGDVILRPKFICETCWAILEERDPASGIYYMATNARRAEIEHYIRLNEDKYKRLVKTWSKK
jgi:hypothetical protein